MTFTAVLVFIALHYVKAGYGMMYTSRWGVAINNKLGWVLMESPVFIAMLILYFLSDQRTEIVPIVFLVIFEIHYFQRSFIFPFLMRGKSKMPISIIASGIIFNLLNAFMQGGWIFYISSPERYPISWLYSPQFIIGCLIFIAGLIINLHSDNIIRHLRKPGDHKHYMPTGGMFNYVSSANYLGEFLEWVGFAVLTWSCAGAVFALWTFANLAPRASKINEKYKKEFGKKFTDRKVKSIIPFIY